MEGKIEITFLKSSLEHIEKSFQIIEPLNPEVQPGRFINFRLNHMKKTHTEILKDSDSDESKNLFADRRYIPEILWLRYSSASIIKTAQDNAQLVSQELIDEMEKYYHSFDNFYQSHISNR